MLTIPVYGLAATRVSKKNLAARAYYASLWFGRYKSEQEEPDKLIASLSHFWLKSDKLNAFVAPPC